MRSAIRAHAEHADTTSASYYTDINNAGMMGGSLFATISNASTVVVVGFGFGAIDSHVNAVIRHAAERPNGPRVIVFVFCGAMWV